MDRWYEDGLRFTCTRCGRCCTGAPGYVWVDEEDIALLCELRQIEKSEFMRRFVSSHPDGLSLNEKANGDCVFWDAADGCTVYEARPPQCRTFPFWKDGLDSPAGWEEMTQICPGAGQGRLHSAEEIEEIRQVGGI